MPFRSETEQLREQIRRVEEETRGLLEERSSLEQQIAGQNHPRRWLIGILAVMIGGAVVGATAGALAASKSAAQLRAIRAREGASDLDRERIKLAECSRADERVASELAECRRNVAEKPRQVVTPSMTASSCPCLDPNAVCDCPFDRGEASSRLSAAQVPIARCIRAQRTASFHVSITFSGTTGEANEASVDGDADLAPEERQCVVAALRAVKVPRFGGSPVRVGKSYSVAGPGLR